MLQHCPVIKLKIKLSHLLENIVYNIDQMQYGIITLNNLFL